MCIFGGEYHPLNLWMEQCGRFRCRFCDKDNRCEKRTDRVKTIIQYSLSVFYIKLSTVKRNNILLNEDFNLGTQFTF